jgi:hypothetical protein
MENIEPALARIDAALRRRGYPSIETLKAAKKGRRPAKPQELRWIGEPKALFGGTGEILQSFLARA